MLKISLTSSIKLDEKAVNTIIANVYCNVFDEDNHNELLGRVKNRKTDSL